MPSPKPTVISLFCGCGGLDLGFEQAGYKIIAGVSQVPDSLGASALAGLSYFRIGTEFGTGRHKTSQYQVERG